ncbi:hypothetical protein U0070_020837 [Myodes glareolus]|uniref:glyceraldehyde-3-phosphate dehydrogenase (phosphorylating) n=1 Tax=Myodes glareolus TaxID=447135 RepID=A0AAW0IPG3_MYOGA
MGLLFHFPTLRMSIIDLTCQLEKAAKYDDVKKVVKPTSEDPLKGILGYTENQVVSCKLTVTPHTLFHL